MKRHDIRSLALLPALVALGGCVAGFPLVADPVRASLGQADVNLSEPLGIDWTTHRINARGLGARRQHFVEAEARRQAGLRNMATFGLKAWPNMGGDTGANGWNDTAPKGRLVTDLNAAFNEVSNGMAAGMYWDVAAGRRFVYMLTQNGRFLRVPTASTNLATDTTALSLPDSFTDTNIVMNPPCTRAYCLSDNGKLYIVNLTGASPTLANAGGTSIGSAALHLSPSLDATQSSHDGTRDVLFVPLNDGNVYKVTVTGNGSAPDVAGLAYEVATTASNLSGSGCEGCSDYNGLKLGASGIAYNGHYYVGDTAGVFHDYDTRTLTDVTYNLGTIAAIAAPPALELQTGAGSYTLSTTGATVSVADGEALYAFVNVTRDAGPTCAWINLPQRTVQFSQPLFVDDADAGSGKNEYGELVSYERATTSSGTVSINLDDAVTVATSASGTLSGSDPYVASPLSASTAGVSGGGGSNVFFRAEFNSSLTAGTRVRAARLRLVHQSPGVTQVPPVFARAGGYDGSGSTGRLRLSPTGGVWARTGNTLSASNAPALYHRGPTTALNGYTSGNQVFNSNGIFTWNVLDMMVGPMRTGHQAFAMVYDSGTVTYGGSGAPKFDGMTAAAGDVPKLEIDHELPTNIPLYPVETGPVLDATNQRVYVYASNYLFALKYSSPAAWMDAVYASGVISPQTTYQASLLARTTGARDTDGKYVRNKTTPTPNFDCTSLYVLSHGRNASAYDFAVSKITPSTGSSAFGVGVGDKADDRPSASNMQLATTYAGTLTSGTGTIANPDASRFMLIDPFERVFTKGGDLYFGLKDPKRIFRVDTD